MGDRWVQRGLWQLSRGHATYMMHNYCTTKFTVECHTCGGVFWCLAGTVPSKLKL